MHKENIALSKSRLQVIVIVGLLFGMHQLVYGESKTKMS